MTETGREAFNHLLGKLRPKLHRYCARMTGSVIDGEDVVQEALVKARWRHSMAQGRSPTRRAGCSASRITPP